MDAKNLIDEVYESTGAVGAAIVSRDGLIVASKMPPGVFVETFGIMCATILGAAITANTEVKASAPNKILIDSGDLLTYIMAAGRRSLLVLIIEAEKDSEEIAGTMAKAAAQVE